MRDPPLLNTNPENLDVYTYFPSFSTCGWAALCVPARLEMHESTTSASNSAAAMRKLPRNARTLG
jgi:hypothetical protein